MNYANYGERAVAYLIDVAYVIAPAFAAAMISIGFFVLSETRALGVLLLVAAGFWLLLSGIYNTVVRQGKSGQTFGKSRRGIFLIREDTGQPVGAGIALVRLLVSWFFNAITGGIYLIADLLAPAFTRKTQRLTDMLLSTVVVGHQGSIQTTQLDTSGLPSPQDDLPS